MSRSRSLAVVSLLLFSLETFFAHAAGAASGAQVASLHPIDGLVWQRTSPSGQHPEGPVLYQIIFRSSATPGNIPVISPQFTLTNSPITVGSGNVAIGGLSVNGTSGIITFANGQTFPSTAGVNSVTAGNTFITIGGTAANPTVGLNTATTDARYLQLGGGTMTGKITFAAGQTFPGVGAGTVTSVSGSAPVNVAGGTTTPVISLAAAGITNALLANPNLTINTGSGLGGGGSVALGGTLTLGNTGLLGLTASAPLAATAGQTPALTLGTVGIGNGGTGITTAPTSAGQYLRSSAAGTWSVNGIQSTDLPSLSGSYVDLSSAQTIGGNKTFTNIISGNISGNAATATTASTANNALALGGNAAASYNTTAQNNLLYLQLSGRHADGRAQWQYGQLQWRRRLWGIVHSERGRAISRYGYGNSHAGL
jgi:hypothetical protein